MNDCSTQITGEHFWSKNVLQELSGGTVVIKGFPWQPTPTMRIGIGALAPKVLCNRHNHALSPLDVQAGRLFRNVRTIEAQLRAGTGARRVVLFAGMDVERWLLKSLMGAASDEVTRTKDGATIAWSPAALWCRILFGQVGFPATWGLYVSGRIGDPMQLEPELSLSPFTNDAGQLCGCLSTIGGLRLLLALQDAPPGRTGGAIDGDSVHRPDELLFLHAPSRTEQSICFTWPIRRGGGQVRIDWPSE